MITQTVKVKSEDTLNSYLKNELHDIPTLNMLFATLETLEQNANSLFEKIKDICKCEIIKTQTLIGGGTTPNKKIPSIALCIKNETYRPNQLEKLFRKNNLIARIENEKLLLDFRTIQENEIEEIAVIIKKIFQRAN